MKKAISLMLTLAIVMSAGIMTEQPAEAASSPAIHSTLANRLPIVTYAMPLSGATRIHPFEDSSLRTQRRDLWIDTFRDEIVITDISRDGRAARVSYPSTAVGVRTMWFDIRDIIGMSTVDIVTYNATTNINVLRMSSASVTVSYGRISTGQCIRLGSRRVGSTTFFPTVYPISTTTVNRVSGIRNKLGLTTHSGATTAPTEPTQRPTDSTAIADVWQNPTNDMRITQAWRNVPSSRRSNARSHHVAIDIDSDPRDLRVMAPANGTVRAARQINGANGRIVVIEHRMSDGRVAFSFFAHLGSISVRTGDRVNRGQEIGRRAAGQHVHFAIVDTLWSAGGYDYVGYAPGFSGDSTRFNNITFFNPSYVLRNNRLPR